MAEEKVQVAFIGLGHMGLGMASSLAKAGTSLVVYNRTLAKAAPLEALGARVAASVASAVAAADVVITMVSDDAAVESIVREMVPALKPTAIHVSCSTISVALTRALAATHSFVAMPVFGRPDAAAAGSLRLVAAGDAAKIDAVEAVVKPMGTLYRFGDDPGAAAVVKLSGNFALATLVEMLSEAYSLCEANGVPPRAWYELMSTTLLAAPAVRGYGGIILDQSPDVCGFSAALGCKDVGLVKAAARASHTPMPLASCVEDRLQRALARGLGEKDWTVVAQLQREDAGLV